MRVRRSCHTPASGLKSTPLSKDTRALGSLSHSPSAQASAFGFSTRRDTASPVKACNVEGMRPGAVVVDMARGALGGNVEGSRPDETLVTPGGVTIVGADNLAATMPAGASTAYARNIAALLAQLVTDGALAIDLTDEIQAGVVITHGGHVVHPGTIRLLEAAAPAAPARPITESGEER